MTDEDDDIDTKGDSEARRERNSVKSRHIAQRVREARQMAGLSQQKLAKMLGKWGYQMGRYEANSHSIPAHILHDVALATGVKVSFFYENMPDDHGGTAFIAAPRLDKAALVDGYEVANKTACLPLRQRQYLRRLIAEMYDTAKAAKMLKGQSDTK